MFSFLIFFTIFVELRLKKVFWISYRKLLEILSQFISFYSSSRMSNNFSLMLTTINFSFWCFNYLFRFYHLSSQNTRKHLLILLLCKLKNYHDLAIKVDCVVQFREFLRHLNITTDYSLWVFSPCFVRDFFYSIYFCIDESLSYLLLVG